MNAVLRITMTYFSIVPLQKWLSIAGAILVAAAVLTRAFPFAIAAFLGAFFIVMIPMFLGGGAMRFGSSRSTLQLRPGSRWKMLLAALLTVCLMTLVCALTMWAMTKADLGRPHRSPTREFPITPIQFALGLWGGFSIVWMISFSASAARLWAMMLAFSIALMSTTKWKPLDALGSAPADAARVLASAGVVCWLIFAFWYLRTRQVRRPGWVSSKSPMGMGENNTGGWYSSLTESKGESRAVAIRAYLVGTTSHLGMLLPGLVAILVILPLQYFQRRSSAGFVALPVTFLAIFTGIAGSVSYMVTRRARTLWLRAGLDRAALFGLSERTALQASAVMVGGATMVLCGYSIAIRPEQWDRILVFAITQLAYGTVLFYFGLSQTRALSAASVAAYIGLGLGLIVQMILVLPQTTGIPPIVAPILTGVSLLLALALRSFARKRWLSLDWHLTRPPVMRRETL